MIDSLVAEPRPGPRCTVAYEAESSTWSAFFGAIPLGRGFPTVSSAWDEVDRMVASRVAPAPAVAGRPADAAELEASRDDGDPDQRPRRTYPAPRGRRSPAGKEKHGRRWRERRAPVPAAP